MADVTLFPTAARPPIENSDRTVFPSSKSGDRPTELRAKNPSWAPPSAPVGKTAPAPAAKAEPEPEPEPQEAKGSVPEKEITASETSDEWPSSDEIAASLGVDPEIDSAVETSFVESEPAKPAAEPIKPPPAASAKSDKKDRRR